MSTDAPAVRCRGLRHRFGDHVALDGVDLTVRPGEVFGLLGPNGAGKTTTIRLINTLLLVQAGTAEVFGYDVERSPMLVRRLLGYVPQQLSIEAALTGRENVAWFARLFDVARHERNERVADALDPLAREGVWQRVEDLQEQTGMTVLLTTHYMEEADVLCDRVAMMHLGTIRTEGSPDELKRALDSEATLDAEATLEDVFRRFTGDTVEGDPTKGGLREVRRTRRTARRVG